MKAKGLILVIALIWICSCTKNDSEREAFQEPIKFNTAIGDYGTNSITQFGTPLDLAGLKASTAGMGVTTSGLTTNMNNLQVRFSSGAWTYTGTYNWPYSSTQPVTFTAFAPRGTSGFTLTASGLTASNYAPTTTVANQVDVLYAPPTTYTRAGSGAAGVSLTLNHIFTQVVVSVTTNVPANQNPRISSIQLRIPKGRGNFNGISWTPITSLRTYTLMGTTNLSIGSTYTSSPAFMIPLSSFVAGTQLRITKIVGGVTRTKVIELNTSDVTSWQMGYKVLYSVNITTATTFRAEVDERNDDVVVTAITKEGFNW